MDIKSLILKTAERRGEIRVADVARATGFSRAYIHRFFQELRREGKIVLVGSANKARYVTAKGGKRRILDNVLEIHKILRNVNLSEDRVLDEIRESTGILTHTRKNVLKIVDYAFTEMLNNAIEHSQSQRIDLRMKRTDDGIAFTIKDWGIGIFTNIMKTRHLASETDAIQDLLKGKETTAPERHSGEGIFFTSKAVDWLVLRGSDKKVVFDNSVHDVFVRDSPAVVGTSVECRVSRSSVQDLTKVFGEFTDEEFQFSRTTVKVHLYKAPGSLISRSEARRILTNLERFKVVELDFANVETIGQGFADEVFRVWAQHHSGVKIEIRNARESVMVMINHVRRQEGPHGR